VNSANFKIVHVWAVPVANEYNRNVLDNRVVLPFVWINAFDEFSWHIREENILEFMHGLDARGYLLQLGDFFKCKMFNREKSFII